MEKILQKPNIVNAGMKMQRRPDHQWAARLSFRLIPLVHKISVDNPKKTSYT